MSYRNKGQTDLSFFWTVATWKGRLRFVIMIKFSRYFRAADAAVEDINQQILTQHDLIGSINDVTVASKADIAELNAASNEINEIINIVKSIADETKLLALNARIEAARAGEAAVEEQAAVTDEIANNADATTHDIKDVSESITRVQNTAEETARFAKGVQEKSKEMVNGLSLLMEQIME